MRAMFVGLMMVALSAAHAVAQAPRDVLLDVCNDTGVAIAVAAAYGTDPTSARVLRSWFLVQPSACLEGALNNVVGDAIDMHRQRHRPVAADLEHSRGLERQLGEPRPGGGAQALGQMVRWQVFGKPADRRVIDRKIGEAYARKGQEKFDTQNWDRALSAAEEGLELDPESEGLNYLAGKCYERKAMDALSKRNDEDRLRYYGKTVEHLEQALKSNPRSIRTMDLLADSYMRIGRETDAVRLWDKIINLAPESLEASKAKGYKASRGFANP